MVRLKNRWLLFELIFEDSLQQQTITSPYSSQTVSEGISSKDIYNVVKESIQNNFGDYGTGCVSVSISVKYFSSHTNIGVLRISRDHYHMVWCALTFITQVKSKNCLLRILHIGGTIKQCQLSAIEYDKDQILKLKRQAELRGEVSYNVEEILEESRIQIMSMDI
ncbi:2991_t:CDS:2 [Entrophospora sp. SA101]|nr:15551_t:CDS:2 [Entrophospora sp. SA101]CAJ0648565.1 15579_t:CDS:2 [Entrophospora sp. SA101]CAJ0745626.1 2991_t:CDS:2 [Entrophospora sp. SA101]CAJ0824406.1 8048_t:CDS:2 [Entrophospora sp. SA101]CAJ0854428.1 789_t:CDS:2 [Entrophospora sp. SA101]